MKNKDNKKVLSNTEVYSKLNPGDIFYGINDTGYAMYRLYDFQWGDGENRVWLGKDNSILYLITENNEKFIWGKEAFLSEEDAKNQLKALNNKNGRPIKVTLKHSDKTKLKSSCKEKTNSVKRSGNTYFDRIMAELDRQEANAKNMPHHCCCCENDEKSADSLFSNSSAINALSDMVVEKFDADNQDLILIEEMSELTKELLKARRGKNNADEIREEMCHVLTSIEVVRKLMGIPLEEINAEVEKKLKEYGKDKADSAESPCEVKETSEDIFKEIKIGNTYEAVKLLEENSEKNLKIEKDGNLYDVNDFFQHCVGKKSAIIIRSFRLLPEEELCEMDASPYEDSVNAEELMDEIKEKTSIISRSLSEDPDEYLKSLYFVLTFDNYKLYELTAEVTEKDIIFRSINSLDEIEED